MRKRLVIGAIAVVVIGVAAYMLSQPRRGSVEYHMEKYSKRPPFERWIDAHYGDYMIPDRLRQLYWVRVGEHRRFHKQALIEAGYLTSTVFVVSNRPAQDVKRAVWSDLHNVFTDEILTFAFPRVTATNTLTVLAPALAMEKLGSLIHQADVPIIGCDLPDP